jgi:hypothetical protein
MTTPKNTPASEAQPKVTRTRRPAAPKTAPRPAAPKAAPKKAAEPKAKAEKVAPKGLPAGYEARWPHGGYDLYRKTDKAADNSPAWFVVCNAHGEVKPVKNAKEGDAAGIKAAKPEWCQGCKAEAAK